MFYLVMMFKNHDTYLVQPGIRDLTDLLYYLLMFGSLPALMAVLLSLPINYLLNTKNVVVFGAGAVVILAVEYLVYTYLASQMDLWNGAINALLSLVTFVPFFSKWLRKSSLKLELIQQLLLRFRPFRQTRLQLGFYPFTKALLPLAKLLLIALLLFASFMRFNLAALQKDQDVLATVVEVRGLSTAPLQRRGSQLNRQINRCNALLLATLVAITGLVVYEHKRPANQAQ